MELKDVKRLLDLWEDDEDDFRKKIKTDAKGAVASHGIVLTPDDENALDQVDWTLPDDQLVLVVQVHP